MSVKLVRQVAYNLAGAFYDNQDVLEQGIKQRSARFRAACKNQHEFVAKYWTYFVPLARKILAHQLALPGTPQHEKDIIFDALLEDRGYASDVKAAAPNIILI